MTKKFLLSIIVLADLTAAIVFSETEHAAQIDSTSTWCMS